jgi:hypothetical protein
MKTFLLLMVGILAVVLLSGCTQNNTNGSVSPEACQAPYIASGSECCLDLDGNSICDENEPGTAITCDDTDLIVVTKQECTKTALRSLPRIFLKVTSADIDLQIIYLNQTGEERLVSTFTDTVADHEYNMAILPITTEGTHIFKIIDNRTKRCVYTSVNC